MTSVFPEFECDPHPPIAAHATATKAAATLWGRMASCAPIGNRRKRGRFTIGPQVANLPHKQIDLSPIF
jgi:hypothetical protein